jgi:Zn-dependent protease with chaperone function
MKRFLEWRKMTWAVALWIGVIVAWGVHAASTSSTVVAGCAADPAFGPSALSQQDCIAQATIGIEFGIVPIAIVGLLGLIVLGVLWFATRPLWRQGYGARLRRLRPQSGLGAGTMQADGRWAPMFAKSSD